MRYFAAVGGTLALLTFCTACRHESAGIHVDRELASRVPSDAPLVFGADVVRLKSAPFYQRHAAKAEVPLLDNLSQRLGIDPRRDLTAAMAYLTVQRQMLVLLHGTFSNDTLQKKLTALGMQPSRDNRKLFRSRDEAVLFIGSGVLEVGAPAGLTGSSDEGPHGLAPAISERLQTLPKLDQIWFASTQGLTAATLPMEGNLGSALQTLSGYITAASGGIGVDEGIHVQADLSCVSAKGAEQVRDALRGFIGLGRLTTRSDEKDMLQIYDSIRVDLDRDWVHVRADLSPELSDRAVQYATRLGDLQR